MTEQEMKVLADMVARQLQGVEERLGSRMDRSENELRTLIEDNHNDICKLLKEDYSPIRERIAEFSDYPETKSTVATLEHASKQYNERLTALEDKKAI